MEEKEMKITLTITPPEHWSGFGCDSYTGLIDKAKIFRWLSKIIRMCPHHVDVKIEG
jgi:hypothetical protein